MGTDPKAAGVAPALADVLVPAANAWALVRAGQSLDRALETVLEPRAIGAVADPARLGGAVRDLASSTVRRWALVEAILSDLLHRPPDPAVHALLAVALTQLLVRSYSDFTLVDQAVRAARAQPRTAGAAGLVNAILREFVRRREPLEQQARADPARRCNVPPWWLQRVQAQYGGARAEAMLTAQAQEPPLVLRVNVRQTDVARVLAQFAEKAMAASQVGPQAVWLHQALPVERIPGFLQGAVSVQDAGAQLAAPWLGVADGMHVLDACAAPGGKTAHVLELADCRLDAVEISAVRAQRIEANVKRLGLPAGNLRIFVADVLQTDTYWSGEQYHRILLDAPCTASGVVRRHPDVVLLRQEGDVANLATQQAKMLRALWPLLAPAGRLLYVVCSVFAEEGRRQVRAFVQRQPGARLLALPVGAPDGVQLLPTPVAGAGLQREDWADRGDGAMPTLHDGFFYALLEKN